jgi:hypothetical protein
MSRPSSTVAECTQIVYESKPKVEENGRKAVFLNPDRAEVHKIRVDGCLVTGDDQRADFIVSKPGTIDVIVELKDRDIYHARDQILATLPFWRQFPPLSSVIAGLIVCSKSPASASDLQVLKAKTLKKFGLWLEVDENERKQYSFSDFGLSR